MRIESRSLLELSAAEKWGDGGGVRSVMPASGVERLRWLRAVRCGKIRGIGCFLLLSAVVDASQVAFTSGSSSRGEVG